MDTHLFYVSLSVYLLGTLLFFLYLIKPLKQIAQSALSITILGFAIHTLLLIIRWLSFDYFPVADLHQSLFFFTWALMGIFLIVAIKFKIPILGSFITPLTAVLLICSATTITNQPVPIPPALRSFWLPIHSTLAFVGEAFFGLACCVGIMYLIQENQIKKKKWSVLFHRLPSLQTLDDLNYLCLSFGFPFLTLGIITGSIWAEYAWGSYWSWDPKETWALITWLIYAALLHGRLMIGWRGKRAAFFSIIGFTAVLFTFLGVNLLLPGLHSYESLTSYIP
ncbi:MAG: c-type cytochrome biogenesis protein CcsB [Proteobacteria bacterium]|nr:c-type cytochrome biogenesis protein CcsB [Pseudomonadota bacterium]